MSNSKPLVSVVTPVYNGEAYLKECIQSVLNQTYQNWEYFIVNNCSTDNSLSIARKYAEQDTRIRIHENTKFLPAIKNFNHALRQIPHESKYCKIIHADDLIFPNCIEELVAVAESDSSVGIVGSLMLQDVRVLCAGLRYPQTVFSGSAICRKSLNIINAPGRIYVFGTPSSLLIRSDLIRSRDPFYKDRYLMVTDQEVCYYSLQHSNFGFVHQVLTYQRVHDQSISTAINQHNRQIVEELMLMQEFGPIYFAGQEHKERFEQALNRYYQYLSTSIVNRKDKEFWEFHKKGFEKLDIRRNQLKLIVGSIEVLINRTLHGLFHPQLTLHKLISR